MADISMCAMTDCPLKAKCYRHTATENEYRQSWMSWTPTKVKNKWTCDGFWDNSKYKRYEKEGINC